MLKIFAGALDECSQDVCYNGMLRHSFGPLGGELDIVEIYSFLFPLLPLFSPSLVNNACPFALLV